MPVFAHVTEGKVHDVNIARTISFPAGSIVVMDRGYVDYSLFKNWTENGIYFVSCLKDNARYCVLENKTVPSRGNIVKDQLIELCGQRANQLGTPPLRRVEQNLKVKTFVGTSPNALLIQIWTASERGNKKI